MKQDMPDISYERNMNHNYIVLSRHDFFGTAGGQGSDYRTRMLLENQIPGLLPVSHRQVNGESRFYYEINSLQSLDRLYDKSEIRYEELKSLLFGCVKLFGSLEEYLLDGSQIIIRPELIYINVERMEPYFVCYPDHEGDVRLAFMEFIDGLLTKIDHTDERAVMLGYQVYRYTRNPNYVISEIGRMMEHPITKMAENSRTDASVPCTVEKDRYGSPCLDAYGERGTTHSSRLMTGAPDRERALSDGMQVQSDAFEQEDRIRAEKDTKDIKDTKDLLGGFACLLIAVCAAAILIGARVLRSFSLSADNELYLYGAVAMAVMASALFFSCHLKKKRMRDERDRIGGLGAEEEVSYVPEPAVGRYDPGVQMPGAHGSETMLVCRDMHRSSDETVCLGDSIVEERMLYGRVDGREISISLKELPVVVGTLAGVSDIVLDDTAVSKMHARFEEREGRVCVCDLNSTNGTVRNGVLLDINRSTALEPGDRIRLGRSSFTYC